MLSPRPAAGTLVAVATALVLSAPAVAGPLADAPVARCLTGNPADLTDDPLVVLERNEQFAPTVGSSNINAQTSNGRMAAGVAADGTLTTLRWPSTMSYQQLKHYGPDARAPRAGAAANEGILLGLVLPGAGTRWLRDFPQQSQRYVDTESDEIETTFVDPARGLTVTVRQVIAEDVDAYVQRVTVHRAPGGQTPTALMLFENLSLNNANVPIIPGTDGCSHELSLDGARFDGPSGAIVHWLQGDDLSTGQSSNIAIAVGVAGGVNDWQVSADAEEDLLGLVPGWTLDAYRDAANGDLNRGGSYSGQTTGALRAPLSFDGDVATRDVAVAGARTQSGALTVLSTALTRGQPSVATGKKTALAPVIAAAPLPDTTDPKELALAKRAIVLLNTSQAPSGAIPAAISVQPPYAEDWPRDGMYFDEALDVMGAHDKVTAHKRFYLRTQRRPGFAPIGNLGVPMGSWPMNMYDTGVVSGPIPYEIDETGFGGWGLWSHYEHTGDRAYLDEAWPGIKLAAEHFVTCKDAATNLQCRATEDDNLDIGNQQTIAGAMPGWLALKAGAAAAAVVGDSDAQARFAARRDELAAAIDAHLWEEDKGWYAGWDIPAIRKVVTYVGWPEPLKARSDARMQRHAEATWEAFAPSFRAPEPGGRTAGFYDGLALIALADQWRGDPAKMQRLKDGLHWIAHTQATADTGLLGENWIVRDNQVKTITAIPQLWQHALFYLAAIEVHGPA
ncbi:MAG: hypothetical protein JHC84_19990 [Solirubrobacteraceae bacterium]|nr:hypothetical protein [Solirubrobacteraceae bacterium]